MDIKDEIDKWVAKIGADKLEPYDTGEMSWALNFSVKQDDEIHPATLDSVMLILSNYRLMLAYQMGLVFARVKYLEDTHANRNKLAEQRALLNIIKPWHDAIEGKIAVVKKIYDKKIREVEK